LLVTFILGRGAKTFGRFEFIVVGIKILLIHVHLKDVDRELTQRMNRGEIDFLEAVAAGIFRPLGDGDLAIPDILEVLESINYRGWVVLEQDVRLPSEPPAGEGPVRAVEHSLRLVTS
jgi:inosose dehydratase